MILTLLLIWFFFWTVFAVPNDDVELNQASFLMTHNAATGEDNGRLNPDSDNQAVSIYEQLECGARALDYRPFLKSNREVIASHGPVEINVKMSDSIKSIKTWLSSNPTELVILYISHGAGEGGFGRRDSYDAAQAVLTNEKVYSIRNCGELAGMTVGRAKQLSRLDSGGYLLALFGCIDEQFDIDIQCYRGFHDCTEGDSLPFLEFDKYMLRSSRFPSVDDLNKGLMFIIQAHWQYDLYDLVVNSRSIILDEALSGLNGRVATKIENGEYNFLNFVQVDNVCNGGPVLKAALDKHMGSNPQANCLSDNNRLRVDEQIVSNNGKYRAKLRSDGQICIYNVGSSTRRWCSGLPSPRSYGGPGIAKMQSDGNLVLYTPLNTAYWSTGTGGSGRTSLVLQNDRDLVIKNRAGQVVWSCSNMVNNKCPLVPCGSNCGSDACRLKGSPPPPPAPPPPPPPPVCKSSGPCRSTPCCNMCFLWRWCI